jgi:hypothetical protein
MVWHDLNAHHLAHQTFADVAAIDLAHVRGYAHFQGIRTWKINDLGEKVFTTGGGNYSTFEDFRISGFCPDRSPCPCDKICRC